MRRGVERLLIFVVYLAVAVVNLHHLMNWESTFTFVVIILALIVGYDKLGKDY